MVAAVEDDDDDDDTPAAEEVAASDDDDDVTVAEEEVASEETSSDDESLVAETGRVGVTVKGNHSVVRVVKVVSEPFDESVKTYTCSTTLAIELTVVKAVSTGVTVTVTVVVSSEELAPTTSLERPNIKGKNNIGIFDGLVTYNEWGTWCPSYNDKIMLTSSCLTKERMKE